MKRAFVFPGQGSQTVGMGKELYDNFAEAKAVFDEVDDVLGQSLTTIIFEGPMEDLTLTKNTQPALMATSIAALRVLEKQSGKMLHDMSSYVAGHSLGEYSALAASGALSLADTTRLLRIRGSAMQQAVPSGQGAMAAVIGLDLEVVDEIASQVPAGEVLQVANDNSEGQVVLSGTTGAIDAAESVAKNHGAKRFLKLPVSAPFHSSLMQPAADAMSEALADVAISTPSVPLVANVIAEKTTDPATIRNLLVQQVTDRVRWRETLLYLGTNNVEQTVEIGAGRVLAGLTKRTVKEMEAVSLTSPDDIDNFVARL